MQILCVKNKGYLHFCPLWGFRGGGGLNNGCANVQQWLRQAYSPPNGDIAFSPTLRFRSFPPLKGNIPLRFALPPFEGGEGGDVPLCSDTVYPA